jgi:hypothetical protein
MFMKNNKSALKKAICDLIDSGCANPKTSTEKQQNLFSQEKPRYVCCCGQISK